MTLPERPRRVERLAIYWDTPEPPYSERRMRETVASNPNACELVLEIHGRQDLNTLYDWARAGKIDTVLVHDMQSLGPTLKARLCTIAMLYFFEVKILPFDGPTFEDIPIRTLKHIFMTMAPRSWEYIERTALRRGYGFKLGRPRKKTRCDKGVPRKGRTPEQAAEIARLKQKNLDRRAQAWEACKARWRAERQTPEYKAKRNAARRKKPVDTPVKPDV